MKSLLFRRFAFTKVELLAVLFIVVVLITLAVQYVPNFITQTQATANNAVLETLNKAVEIYRMQGGVQKSHSLTGVTTPTKIYHVLNALANGFMGDDGRRYTFINFAKPLNPNALAVSGNGNSFVFAAVTGDLYAPTAGYLSAAEIDVGGAIDYGWLYLGRTVTGYFPIKNTGSSPLTVSSISVPSGYTLTGWTSGTVAGGAIQYVPVTFSPSAASTYSGNIVVSSNATVGNGTLAITGLGVVVPGSYSEIAYLTSNNTGTRTVIVRSTTGYAMGKSSAGTNTATFGTGDPSADISVTVASTNNVQFSVWPVASSGSTVSGQLTNIDVGVTNFDGTIKSINITELSALNYLRVRGNIAMTSLNCFGKETLATLDITNCQGLTSLNIYGCTGLTTIEAYQAQGLPYLNCFGLAALQTVSIGNSWALNSYNFNGCVALESINFRECHAVTAINFESYLPSLTTIDFSRTGVTSVDLSRCTALTTLSCGYPGGTVLPSLDLSVCPTLVRADCANVGNVIVNNPAMTRLVVMYAPTLTSLNVTGAPNLDTLGVGTCINLASLDLSAQTVLRYFDANGCTSLSSLTINSSLLEFAFVLSCSLNTAQINGLLSHLDPALAGWAQLTGNPGLTPLDGATDAYITSLVASGWLVNYL